tara:strand:- start:2115 stop:2696 length:582 start_codon:yes stop_codon:yes gene_type:complete
MNYNYILSLLISILLYIILEDKLDNNPYIEYNKYLNENLLISILVLLLTYFILDLLDKYKRISYERFTIVDTPNINSLDNQDSLKISILNIQDIFTNNTFFGSKYQCDNFILLLDDVAYDYNNADQLCNLDSYRSFSHLDNFNDLITVESKRNALKNHLIDYINFIPQNIVSLRNEIDNIIYLLFNEYFYNCS